MQFICAIAYAPRVLCLWLLLLVLHYEFWFGRTFTLIAGTDKSFGRSTIQHADYVIMCPTRSIAVVVAAPQTKWKAKTMQNNFCFFSSTSYYKTHIQKLLLDAIAQKRIG